MSVAEALFGVTMELVALWYRIRSEAAAARAERLSRVADVFSAHAKRPSGE